MSEQIDERVAAERVAAERVAALEVRISEVTNQGAKIDRLMDLVNEVKLSIVNIKNDFVGKEEFKKRCSECDERFEISKASRKQLFSAMLVAGIGLIGWLLQQLLQIHIKIGS